MIGLATIDGALPRSDPCRYGCCFVFVTGPDRSRQTIGRIVCDFDRLFSGGVLDHAQHRSEDFLLSDDHIVGDIGENRRHHVMTVGQSFRHSSSTDNADGIRPNRVV